MGIVLDLRPVFEEKRVIDASIRIERNSTTLLQRALGGRNASIDDNAPENTPRVIEFTQRHRSAPSRHDRRSC